MILQETVDFLRTVPPFQFLEEPALTAVARASRLEFFPRGSLVVRPGKRVERLFVIKKGGVRLFLERAREPGGQAGDGEVALDVRGEGEVFGYSALAGERSRTGARVIEDALCYLVEPSAVREAAAGRPDLRELFSRSAQADLTERALEELRRKSSAAGQGESLLFAAPAGEVADREFARAGAGVSVRRAAEIMSAADKSALLAIDEAGEAVGIVTDSDFRAKVVARGVDPESPISAVMSSPVAAVKGSDLCLEAMLTMIRRDIHHVAVTERGRVAGLLSSHDVMMLQGLSPLVFLRKIEAARRVEELQNVSLKVSELAGLLAGEGARASATARIVAELNDQLMRRLFALAEERLGPPPVPYCFIVFGSEGRKEQIYRTDQDNALIYADAGEDPAVDALVETRFARLAEFVVSALQGAGFPSCPAGYMASNPTWRRSLKSWKKLFSSWIAEPSAEAVLGSMIFFDFRPVCGDFRLAEELRARLQDRLDGERAFLGRVAAAVVRNRPPMGFFKGFIVERGGEHKDAFNIKIKGLAPVVDLVRLFALEKGVSAASTVERVRELEGCHGLARERGEELLAAFEFLLALRASRHKAQTESGQPLDNWVQPDRLSPLERRTLRQTFSLIGELQELVIERYREFVW